MDGNSSVLRRLLFATSFLPSDIPNYWDIIARFASTTSCSEEVSPEAARIAMENQQVLNNQAFISDVVLTKQLIGMEYEVTRQPLGIPLVPCETNCLACGGKLSVRGDRPSRISIYTQNLGTVPGTHFHKYCRNSHKGCKFIQYYGYHKLKDKKPTYSSSWMALPYFVSSQETGFELAMLKNYDVELLVGQVSYQQKADIYNITNEYDMTKKTCSSTEESKGEHSVPVHGADIKRQQLDRRRFEAAHLKYASLQMAAWYPEGIGYTSIKVEGDVMETLNEITPALFCCFEAKYAAHKCNFPGCASVLVIDGNSKNRRDVCYAKDAGFIQFNGLSGSIKTGCTATPTYKSRYCAKHISQACTQLLASEDVDEELGAVSGPATRSRHSKPGIVAELILAKKQTRKQLYYQVLWLGLPECQATWEPASSLPKHLLEQYEAGVVSESALESAPLQYGHLSTTLTVSQQQAEVKRRKKERPCLDDLEGTFKEQTEHLTCRTEKDRYYRLNFRTAGVLAGMWPCGIVTFIRELFVAESKSQVYGHLHQFLQSNAKTASNLKYICYDDGCHLRKYSQNPIRCNSTATAKLLSNINIVIDKMHMAGHVDSWCKQVCDPKLFTDLAKVDTEVCEQVFSWLSRYKKMTQKMNRHTFIFFLLYICELHNQREIVKLHRGLFISSP